MSYQAQEMEELNRRVATEVMGEPEPPLPTTPELYPHATPRYPGGRKVRNPSGFRGCFSSDEGNWLLLQRLPEGHQWRPVRFSGSMDLAMCAVDTVLAPQGFRRGLLQLSFDEPRYWTAYLGKYGHGEGRTAPEAIVRCLLAFVEGDQ